MDDPGYIFRQLEKDLGIPAAYYPRKDQPDTFHMPGNIYCPYIPMIEYTQEEIDRINQEFLDAAETKEFLNSQEGNSIYYP